MPPPTGVTVSGFTELQKTAAQSEATLRADLNANWRRIAEPVADGAEALAVENIPRIGDKWYQMRPGITQSMVYVAPRQRGRRGADPRKRRKFAGLLMDRAMEPALERNRTRVEHEVEEVLDRFVDKFNRGGI